MKRVYIKYVGFCCLFVPFYSSAEVQLDWGGYLMLDHDHFDERFLENGEGDTQSLYFRRARIKLNADVGSAWSAKLQLDGADGLTVKDASLSFDGWRWAAFTLGRQKEPFGIERLTGSSDLPLIERTMVSNALAPGRSLGLSAGDDRKHFGWRIGYFRDDLEHQADALTGRAYWVNKDKQDNVFQLGAAFSERRAFGSAFRINEPLEVYSADSLVEGKKLTQDKRSLQGVEMLWQYHGLASMAEWQQAEVQTEAGESYRYDGGYYQLSYAFSGQNRAYKNGEFKSPGANGWEIALRASQFNMVREDRWAKSLTLGLNYYPAYNFKVMANVIRGDYSFDGQDAGTAVSLRAQYSF